MATTQKFILQIFYLTYVYLVIIFQHIHHSGQQNSIVNPPGLDIFWNNPFIARVSQLLYLVCFYSLHLSIGLTVASYMFLIKNKIKYQVHNSYIIPTFSIKIKCFYLLSQTGRAGSLHPIKSLNRDFHFNFQVPNYTQT